MRDALCAPFVQDVRINWRTRKVVTDLKAQLAIVQEDAGFLPKKVRSVSVHAKVRWVLPFMGC